VIVHAAEEKGTTGMQKIVDIVPSTRRAVDGVDASGRWPGAADNDPGAGFVGYLYPFGGLLP
jgi:hypothetical protein